MRLSDQGSEQKESVLREQPEVALKMNACDHSANLNHLNIPYFELDIKGHFIFVNDLLCRKTGYSREEFMKLSPLQCYAKREEMDGVLKCLNNMLQTNIPVTILEADFLCKDGSTLSMEMSLWLNNDDYGTATGFKGIARDLSDRKKGKSELQRYQNFIGNIQDGCFEIDLHGNVTFCNERAYTSVGYMPEEYFKLRPHQRFSTRQDEDRLSML